MEAPLSPAVVRLYARAWEIECEIEELIEDGDYMSTDELLAWLKRPYKQREAAWVDHLCWWRQPSHLRVVGPVKVVMGHAVAV